jgi:mono/diheme cytochrome c family protein
MLRKALVWFGVTSVILLVLIQLVPYGRDHDNPPVTGEPAWDSPATRALSVTACFDCHGNETAWPWYTNVAPISWLVQRDVDEGREVLNFSEWGSGQEANEAAEAVREGEMPPASYLWLHPDARFSDADRQALIDGLVATFGAEGTEGGEEGEGDE